MSAQTVSVDTSVLPADVLSFYDNCFYELVAKIAGLGVAQLFEVQGIRSVHSFLHTTDVFDILSISCVALKDVRPLICPEADDHTFIVKPGCRSGVRYLYQLLQQKNEEHLKEITKKSRRQKHQRVQLNDNSAKVHSQDSSPDATTASDVQQSTISVTSMKEDDHREFILHTLNEWFDKHSSIMNISNGKLIENQNFKLSLACNDSTQEAYFSCSCGVKVQVTKHRDTFSLSNYYKHLKSKNCSMMKKKRTSDKHTNDESLVNTDQESVDDEASQNSVSNLTQSSISSTGTTTYLGRLLKRSTISEDVLPKRRRIQK